MPEQDLLIVGAGPVGLALALALKDAGLTITLADSRDRGAARQDPRMLALAHGTRLTLERLGVWQALDATPIRTIRVSQQGGLGATWLRERDYHVPALGYVLSAGNLAAALDDAVARAGIPVREHTTITRIAPAADDVLAEVADGEPLRARLVACAEGLIQGDGAVIERDYGQHAVISMVTPARPHQNIAHERFTALGPVALLPAGRQFAVVHTASPQRAEALLALDDSAYLAELQAVIGSNVPLAQAGPRLRYPLGLRYRDTPVGPRTVWLGNAAQTLHPVAGQGFNLALRDVWALAETLLRRGEEDPGGRETLATYARRRRTDRRATIGFTDSLVRLFSNDFPPLHHARGLALMALEAVPPLRHFVAKRMMFGARAWP